MACSHMNENLYFKDKLPDVIICKMDMKYMLLILREKN